ncbi:MAG TPA: TAXI family TRAP transporter solute-binding subunit [Xanthobacteraceae bacterium]|nr:TAXI family TRAP transporter solute-binding subunit [Xanthobacteraceae bacterium]
MKHSAKTLILAAGLVAAVSAAAPAAEMKFMTGPQGGSWIPLGGQLKDLWEKNIKGMSVSQTPGAGIANVRGVEEGKTDLGFGNSISTVDAVAGRAPFNKPHANVCNIATLYPQYYQMVVPKSANIKSVKDLKGKGVTTQQKGNTGELITSQILKVNGMSYDDVKASFVSYTDSVSQMKDGHAVAFGLGTTIPAGAIMDIASSQDITLIDMTDLLAPMKKLNPGYTLVTVPKGTYPKQDQDIKVIGYATHLVVSCKAPDDTVHALTKTIASNVPALGNVVAAMKGLTTKMMAEDIGVPFHPGAAKFYKEAGITVKSN